jgi:hypothetical protein
MKYQDQYQNFQYQNFQQQQNQLIQNDYEERSRIENLYRQGQISEDKYRENLKRIQDRLYATKGITSFSKPGFQIPAPKRVDSPISNIQNGGVYNGQIYQPFSVKGNWKPTGGKSNNSNFVLAGNNQNGYKYVPGPGWSASKYTYSSQKNNGYSQPTPQVPQF